MYLFEINGYGRKDLCKKVRIVGSCLKILLHNLTNDIR